MSAIVAALARNGAAYPAHCALTDGDTALDYRTLYRHVVTLAGELRTGGTRVVALALPNGPAWMIADLAALAARIPCAPVPPFFSAAQQHHLLSDAAVDTVLTDDPDRFVALLGRSVPGEVRRDDIAIGPWRCARLRVRRAAAALPPDTAKITYTSGTTGAPKGVCIRAEALDAVARSLADACELGRGDRHSSLLPLATLLENVGVYAHLYAGGRAAVRPLAALASASGTLDGSALIARLCEDAATTAILVPEMLRAMVQALSQGARQPQTVRLLAVGGAPVSLRLLAEAARLGLPAYEGYGLTECASVVALNTPRASRHGTVGRPLPHVEVSVDEDGEILVRGPLYAGYVGGAPRAGEWHRTGDRGALDADGYLRLIGRSRNIFITSHGRNVSPEWVESELTAHPAIAQAWVYGEARPWNVAVIVPAPGAEAADVDAAVAAANAELPPYAQVRRWVPAAMPFTASNGQLTANGRLRRDALAAAYRPLLNAVYIEETHDVS